MLTRASLWMSLVLMFVAGPVGAQSSNSARTAWRATFPVPLQNETASAFFVRVGQGPRLVTARHVINAGTGCERKNMENLQVVEKREGREFPVNLDFTRAPGECNIEMDYASHPAQNGNALGVIREGEALRPGEAVVITGFHMGRKRMTQYQCTFAGFIEPYENAKRVFYHIHCPAAERNNINGMSGGPVVSVRLNKVIGFLSSQEAVVDSSNREIDTAHLSYSPIYETATGELRSGFSANYSNVSCRFIGKRFRCDVSASGHFRSR